MSARDKTEILVVRIPPALKRQVDKAGKAWKCRSISDAVRQLLEYGLLFADAIGKEHPDGEED